MQDYSAVVAKHRAENADITVVSHPIPASQVGAVGILKIDPSTGAHLARRANSTAANPCAELWLSQ